MGKRREGDLGQVSSRTEKLSGSKKKKKKLPADKLFKKKNAHFASTNLTYELKSQQKERIKKRKKSPRNDQVVRI